jgi:hypothetical protein
MNDSTYQSVYSAAALIASHCDGFATKLMIPSWPDLQSAAHICWSQSFAAGQANYHFWTLLLRPLFLALYYSLSYVARNIVKVLYYHGLGQLWALLTWLYNIQIQMTQRQLLMEFILIVGAAVLRVAWKWFQRQTYGKRAAVIYRVKRAQFLRRYRRQKRQLVQVR